MTSEQILVFSNLHKEEIYDLFVVARIEKIILQVNRTEEVLS